MRAAALAPAAICSAPLLTCIGVGQSAAPATLPQPPWPTRGTVLITGGTGALGALIAAEHLVTRHGVRRLLLLSRRGRAAGVDPLGATLTARGAEVEVAAWPQGSHPAATDRGRYV
ncbi:KR domain-containing protein [Streptomyces sp. NPDC088116]|uniref:KR domain-containing protein n=1 Tax=Streptomyces sp. NPDC088116 TaxID=3365825 RepID=UPI0038098F0F